MKIRSVLLLAMSLSLPFAGVAHSQGPTPEPPTTTTTTPPILENDANANAPADPPPDGTPDGKPDGASGENRKSCTRCRIRRRFHPARRNSRRDA